MADLFKKFFAVIFVAAVAISAQTVVAQETEDALVSDNTETPSDQVFLENGKTMLVADVDVWDGAILSQEGSEFMLQFGMRNNRGTQSDIHYSVELSRALFDDENALITMDVETYDDMVTLREGESVVKTIPYNAPDFLAGEYTLRVVAENSAGLPFGVVSLGKVTLEKSREYIELDEEACEITTVNESGNYPSRPISFGASIERDQFMLVSCAPRNHFSEDKSVRPVFQTMRHGVYGETIQTGEETSEAISIPAHANSGEQYSEEQYVINILVPTAKNPQMYEVAMFLEDAETEDIVSNTIRARYTVRGESATIQNIIFDKGSYNEGDTANVQIFWTSSPDVFSGEQIGDVGAPARDAFTLKVSLLSANGEACADPYEKKIERIDEALNIPVTKKCLNPNALFSIVNSDGNVLAEQTVSLKNAEQEDSRGAYSFSVIAFALALALTLIGILLIIFKRPRARGSVGMLLLPALFAAGVLMHPGDASAATFAVTDGGAYFRTTFTVGVDKSTYEEGETITASGAVTWEGPAYAELAWLSLSHSALMHPDNTLSVDPAGKYELSATYDGSTSYIVQKQVSYACTSPHIEDALIPETEYLNCVMTGTLSDDTTESTDVFFTATLGSEQIVFYGAAGRNDSWYGSDEYTANITVTPSSPPPPHIGTCLTPPHGGTFAAIPPTGIGTLCQVGESTWSDTEALDGTWNWSCTGVGVGGTTVGCYANKSVTPVTPVSPTHTDCKSPPNGGTYSVWPGGGKCTVGNTGTWTDQSASDGTWNWFCEDAGTVTHDTRKYCEANKDTGGIGPAVPGICGLLNGGVASSSEEIRYRTNGCARGSFNWLDELATDGVWNWACLGRPGIGDDGSRRCSASRAETRDGECGPSDGTTSMTRPYDLCSYGLPQWTDLTATDGTWNWDCLGTGGGNSVSCETNKFVDPLAFRYRGTPSSPCDGSEFPDTYSLGEGETVEIVACWELTPGNWANKTFQSTRTESGGNTISVEWRSSGYGYGGYEAQYYGIVTGNEEGTETLSATWRGRSDDIAFSVGSSCTPGPYACTSPSCAPADCGTTVESRCFDTSGCVSPVPESNCNGGAGCDGNDNVCSPCSSAGGSGTGYREVAP